MLTFFTAAIAPLLLLRTLGGLAPVSALKVGCSLAVSAALVTLAAAAARKGG